MPADTILSPKHESLKESVQQHAEAILRLKSHWNSMIPISRLPPEILFTIFDIIVEESVCDGNDHPRHWCAFSHVCRRWRSIALDCAKLWNCITFDADLDCLSELLSRTKSAELEVDVSIPKMRRLKAKKRRFLQDLLKKEISRISFLHVPLYFKIKDIGRADILETLCLDGVAGGKGSKSFSSILYGDNAPMLVHLGMIEVHSFVWQPSVYRQKLTTLILKDCSPCKTVPIDDITAALEKLPALKKLELSHSLPPNISPSGSTSRVVTMPQLDTVELHSADMILCANFLSYLDLPVVRRLSVYGNLPVDDPAFQFAKITHIPNLTSVCMDKEWEMGKNRVHSQSTREIHGRTIPTEILFEWHSLRGGSVDPGDLGAVLKLLPLSKTEQFEASLSFQAEAWVSFLSQLQHLRQLKINDIQVLPLLSALLLPDYSGYETRTTPVQSFLPHLRDLTFDFSTFPIPEKRQDFERLQRQLAEARNTIEYSAVKIERITYGPNCTNLDADMAAFLRGITGATDNFPPNVDSTSIGSEEDETGNAEDK